MCRFISKQGKSSSLGKVTIDLAEYAADGTNVRLSSTPRQTQISVPYVHMLTAVCALWQASREYKVKMGGTKKGESKEAVLTVRSTSTRLINWLKVTLGVSKDSHLPMRS
jgi:hypothetical protein